MAAPPQRPDDFRPPMASSIVPPDTTDTIVLESHPEEQIAPRAGELRRYDDIVYNTVDVAERGVRELKLDILRPATDQILPLLVDIPGGAFRISNRESAPVLRAFVAESGFVVASAEYRVVSDNATYVESVRDVRTAVAYLRTHAHDFGIDPRAAGVWGESAGGYLAAMLGVTNDRDQFYASGAPARAGHVDAVIDSFGLSKFSELAAAGVDAEECHELSLRLAIRCPARDVP